MRCPKRRVSSGEREIAVHEALAGWRGCPGCRGGRGPAALRDFLPATAGRRSSCDMAERRRKVVDEVTGDQPSLPQFSGAEVSRQAVQVGPGAGRIPRRQPLG